MIPLAIWSSIWKEWSCWVYEGNILLLRVQTLLFVDFVLVVLCIERDQYLTFFGFPRLSFMRVWGQCRFLCLFFTWLRSLDEYFWHFFTFFYKFIWSAMTLLYVLEIKLSALKLGGKTCPSGFSLCLCQQVLSWNLWRDWRAVLFGFSLEEPFLSSPYST